MSAPASDPILAALGRTIPTPENLQWLEEEAVNRFTRDLNSDRLNAVLTAIANTRRVPAAALQRLQPVPPTPTIAVRLQGARQQEAGRKGEPACTFHAVTAMSAIGGNFDVLAREIKEGRTADLSRRQNGIIDAGLVTYKQFPKLKGGADINQLIDGRAIPANVQMNRKFDDIQLVSFDTRLNDVVNHLYSPDPRTKVVWIKNGNDESFAVITKGTESILFDSHQNEIILTTSREITRQVLDQKLRPFSQEMDGIDLNLFACAFGYHNG
jgi:hypothetical protein